LCVDPQRTRRNLVAEARRHRQRAAGERARRKRLESEFIHTGWNAAGIPRHHAELGPEPVAAIARRQVGPAAGRAARRARVQRRDLAERSMARIPVGRVRSIRSLRSAVSRRRPGALAGFDGRWHASHVEPRWPGALLPGVGPPVRRVIRKWRGAIDGSGASRGRERPLSTVRHARSQLRYLARRKTLPVQGATARCRIRSPRRPAALRSRAQLDPGVAASRRELEAVTSRLSAALLRGARVLLLRDLRFSYAARFLSAPAPS